MAKAARRDQGDKIGTWRLEERISGGGNGVVWRVSKNGQPDRALKILRKLSPTTRDRLQAEIGALKMAAGVDGIVPLLDHDIPHNVDKGPQWFVMPMAAPPATAFKSREAVEIVRPFVALAQTLAQLHTLNIHHRDIKPANLLALDGRLCFSDFGLVKYPTRKDITPEKGDVGPKFTMAPEMRRQAARAAGGPADVYSLAKTLWIMLTEQAYGFDGQYSSAGVLAVSRYHKDILSAPLDDLLVECTDNDPLRRPTAEALASRLADWISLQEDFHQRNLKEWAVVQNQLFPLGSPSHATWTDINDICAVLRLVSRTPSLNHLFYPDGGGNTIESVTLAGEPGLIVIKALTVAILKPRKLTFESFGLASAWNYFRLEADVIASLPVPGGYVDAKKSRQTLCELSPGQYVSVRAWDNDEHEGTPLPAGARLVNRYLGGAFVIFSTRSHYNLDPATYDGRHNKVSEADFRQYIASHVTP
jgi:serine/threonine-protein kinase